MCFFFTQEISRQTNIWTSSGCYCERSVSNCGIFVMLQINIYSITVCTGIHIYRVYTVHQRPTYWSYSITRSCNFPTRFVTHCSTHLSPIATVHYEPGRLSNRDLQRRPSLFILPSVYSLVFTPNKWPDTAAIDKTSPFPN